MVVAGCESVWVESLAYLFLADPYEPVSSET